MGSMKKELRKELMERRKGLSEGEVLEKSKEIEKRLFGLNEFKQAPKILFYVSYDNEVSTHEMIKKCLSDKRSIAIPITNKKNKNLDLSKLEKWDDLAEGTYKILESKKEKIKKIQVKDVDLIIVPGVGFDREGNRLGHGKGYYDGLLSCSKALKVGLAFDFQIVKRIPVEAHDVKMDKIITEKRIIDCRRN